MKKLSDCIPQSQPGGWKTNDSTDPSTPASLEFQRARRVAGRLLRELAPLVSSVRAATKDQASAGAWMDAWARQILAVQLSEDEIKVGLSRLSEAPQDRPFDWNVFCRLCRPAKEAAHEVPGWLRLPEPVDQERGRAEISKIKKRFGW